MMIPGRAVNRRITSLFAARSMSIELMPADFRRSFNVLPQLHVFVQQVGVIAVGVPARLPGLVVAQAKSVWMCLLSQSFPLRYFFDGFRAGFFFPASAWRAFFTAPATPFCDSASAAAAATRCCAAM